MIQETNLIFSRGFPKPFGATVMGKKTNFALFCPTEIPPTLRLFKRGETTPFYELIFDSLQNRTGNVWHVLIENLPSHLSYTYRFKDVHPDLLDPYAKGVISHRQWNIEETGAGYRPQGAILQKSPFDWENDTPLNLPIEELIIYEMHVKAFTADISSQVEFPGTFKGMTEKIAYLRELGITAVELLPVQEFNEMEYNRIDPISKEKLCNFWGYSTVNYFSLMGRYAADATPEGAINEFKALVKELHRNGIEVILDVVYNHTAEGNGKGPTLSFKGFSDSTYYILQADGSYEDYTGCGNTINCNHPVVIELILASLRYWVSEMHIDGFRFDLASIFYRGENGAPIANPPLLRAISQDPILARTKLIAEPWDAIGLFHVGNFYSDEVRWHEWNSRYRDSVRKFIKGVPGSKEEFATRICGSQDLYHNRNSHSSINFITAHDGFSLVDLVSYNQKHNIANGENNHDGNSFNDSWNCGIEGSTIKPEIISLRQRQIRNFHLSVMISQGVPMLSMGDEYGHTKIGNNNTWCQNNQLNWFLWNKLDEPYFRFYRLLIAFRKSHWAFKRVSFFTDADIEWHGLALGSPRWDMENHFIAFTLKDPSGLNDLYVAFNAQNQHVTAEIPTNTPEKNWFWVVNTNNPPPLDFMEGKNHPLSISSFTFEPYSAILLQTI